MQLVNVLKDLVDATNNILANTKEEKGKQFAHQYIDYMCNPITQKRQCVFYQTKKLFI